MAKRSAGLACPQCKTEVWRDLDRPDPQYWCHVCEKWFSRLQVVLKSRVKPFNGKPMKEWEATAKRLVVEQLVRASMVDERSLVGKIACARLMRLAKRENVELLKDVLEERQRCQTNLARFVAGFSGRAKRCRTSSTRLKAVR